MELEFFNRLSDEKDKFNSYEFMMLQNQLAVFFFLYNTFLENKKGVGFREGDFPPRVEKKTIDV